MNPSHCFCLSSYALSSQGWEFLVEGGATVVFRHNELCLVLKSKKRSLSLSLQHGNSVQQYQDSKFTHCMIMLIYGYEVSVTDNNYCLSETDYTVLHNLWTAERSLYRKKTFHDQESTLGPSVCLDRYAYSFCGSKRSRSIGFEFKVKRGFPSQTPFIAEHNGYIKHRMGRFQLMQLYKQAKKHASLDTQTNWGEFLCQSHYNPTDLCSKVNLRIENAISALFFNPQNNLQMFANGRLIYGSTQCDRLACISEISSLLFKANQPFYELDAMIQRIVIKVVEASDIFMRLECLQYLDFIDAEGAAIIYQRLCELHSAGSREKNEVELSSFIFDYFQAANDTTDWYEFAATLRDNKFTTAPENLNLSSGICALLSLLISDVNIDTEEKKRRYESAISLAATQLTFQDCLFLLKAWMIGCVAADASIAVCIVPVTNSELFTCDDGDVNNSDRHTIAVQVPDNNGTNHTFLARLTVLDVGVKSFSKFESKARSDAEICRVVTEYLNSMTKIN